MTNTVKRFRPKEILLIVAACIILPPAMVVCLSQVGFIYAYALGLPLWTAPLFGLGLFVIIAIINVISRIIRKRSCIIDVDHSGR